MAARGGKAISQTSAIGIKTAPAGEAQPCPHPEQLTVQLGESWEGNLRHNEAVSFSRSPSGSVAEPKLQPRAPV